MRWNPPGLRAHLTCTRLQTRTAARAVRELRRRYGAFGDKRELYLETLARYREMGRNAMRRALSWERPLADELRAMFARAISIYTSGDHGARGCYLIGTAATEAVLDPQIRAMLGAGLHELDDQLEARIRQAIEQGDLDTDITPWRASSAAS